MLQAAEDVARITTVEWEAIVCRAMALECTIPIRTGRPATTHKGHKFLRAVAVINAVRRLLHRRRPNVRHPIILAHAVALAVVACFGLAEAKAASRYYQTYSEASPRSGYNSQHYGYPRPGCTFAIQGYQRLWPSQLWPPSMRCFPYR